MPTIPQQQNDGSKSDGTNEKQHINEALTISQCEVILRKTLHEFMSRFEAKGHKHVSVDLFDNPIIQLKNLKQTSTVKEYHDSFVSINCKVQLAPEYALDCFLDGLTEEIQWMVRLFNPQNIHDAYSLAKLQEFNIKMQKSKVSSDPLLIPAPTNNFQKAQILDAKPTETINQNPGNQIPNAPVLRDPNLSIGVKYLQDGSVHQVFVEMSEVKSIGDVGFAHQLFDEMPEEKSNADNADKIYIDEDNLDQETFDLKKFEGSSFATSFVSSKSPTSIEEVITCHPFEDNDNVVMIDWSKVKRMGLLASNLIVAETFESKIVLQFLSKLIEPTKRSYPFVNILTEPIGYHIVQEVNLEYFGQMIKTENGIVEWWLVKWKWKSINMIRCLDPWGQ